MKRILIIAITIISSISIAQSEPQFTMFWNNYTMFNPANTGLNYQHYGNMTYRSQWDKVENAPNTFTGLYETKLEKYHSGIGGGYLRDIIGYGTDNRFYLNYAYHVELENSVLSFGTSLFLNRKGFNGIWNAPQTGTNTSLDPNLPTGIQTKVNLNFGIVYKREKLEIGVSSTRVNEPYYDKLSFTAARNYFGMLAYTFNLAEQFTLKPALYFKTDGVAAALDINTLFTLKNKYWLGLTLRSTNSFGGQLGFDLKEKFRVGYSYDYITGILGNYTSGTHEITFGLLIK